MLNKYDVAQYFLSLDPNRELFNQRLVNMNNATFYEGNARLNKYMHLSQNIYAAMTGELLIDAKFFAYNNGAVIPDIQKNYPQLLLGKFSIGSIPEDIKIFLKKIFEAFKNADIEEIIDIDHEDQAWIDKSNAKTYKEQEMDTLGHIDEYRVQYADMIKILDRMVIA